MKSMIPTAAFLMFAATTAQAGPRAVSPDGRHVALIVENGAGRDDGTGAQSLMIETRSSGTRHRLLLSRYSEDARAKLTNLTTPLFSPDGGFLYVSSSDAAPTSGAVHRIDLKTGAIRFVVAGAALSVIRTGPFRGYLLVQQHRYFDRPEGGSCNPVAVVRPDGHQAMMIPGSETDDGERAVEPWLATKGWRAW